MSETIILAIVVCSCMVFIALIIAVGVLIYNYQDNIQCWGESFIKKYPKQSIEILESNGFLKDDKSPKD